MTGVRQGAMRDRRGRGLRGIAALPGPLSPDGVPTRAVPRTEFERLVRSVVAALAPAFRAESVAVEIVVEDAPPLPDGWTDPVPTWVVNEVPGGTRLVLFRLPITGRAHGPTGVEDLVWSLLLERLAEIWQVDPEDLDPR